MPLVIVVVVSVAAPAVAATTAAAACLNASTELQLCTSLALLIFLLFYLLLSRFSCHILHTAFRPEVGAALASNECSLLYLHLNKKVKLCHFIRVRACVRGVRWFKRQYAKLIYRNRNGLFFIDTLKSFAISNEIHRHAWEMARFVIPQCLYSFNIWETER